MKVTFRTIFYGIILTATFFLFFSYPAFATKEDEKESLSLYASSAVLIDADSGRVLYGKNEEEIMANASTTKILTCILILENCGLEDEVTVSAYAASMPKVHLGMREGDTYRVKDLLYSLMLESHNDSAVALAEHMSGSVEAFAEKMNEKAAEIGCEHSFFLTPNGLDSEKEVNGETKFHSTTAVDLARIMRYCMKESSKKEEFLEITQTKSISVSCLNRSYTVSLSNHNQLFSIMEGAVSGKTGFTAKAGYCYVGAIEQDGESYIVALLACGWPNNKSYKWSDCRELFTYGLTHYAYKDFQTQPVEKEVQVMNGMKDDGSPFQSTTALVTEEEKDAAFHLLTAEGESVKRTVILDDIFTAPLEKGEILGEVIYTLEGEDGESTELARHNLVLNETVPEWNLAGILKYILHQALFSIAF